VTSADGQRITFHLVRTTGVGIILSLPDNWPEMFAACAVFEHQVEALGRAMHRLDASLSNLALLGAEPVPKRERPRAVVSVRLPHRIMREPAVRVAAGNDNRGSLARHSAFPASDPEPTP
jgi:hypothetical protein